MVEEVNLLEDPGPAVGGQLVNDLNCILHLCLDVDARLPGGVIILAKNFSCQSIEFLECV